MVSYKDDDDDNDEYPHNNRMFVCESMWYPWKCLP